jgi:hypothetical protein
MACISAWENTPQLKGGLLQQGQRNALISHDWLLLLLLDCLAGVCPWAFSFWSAAAQTTTTNADVQAKLNRPVPWPG